MHRLFSSWYWAVKLEPKSDELNKRWEAIESYTEELDVEKILNLVKLFYGKKFKDNIFVDEFSDAFSEVDVTFKIRDNDIELQILAGSSIICFMEKNNNSKGNIAAYSMVCASYCHTIDVPIPEIVEIAKEHLLSKAQSLRELYIQGTEDTEFTVNKYSSKTKPQDPNQITQAFSDMAEYIHSTVSSLCNQVKKANNEIQALKEECNILWWVLGECSNILERRLSNLELPERCLIVGMELADKITIIPAPISIRYLISKSLHSGTKKIKSVTLKEAINTASVWKEKRESTLKFFEKSIFCPINFAIEKSLETDQEDDWCPIFTKATKTEVDTPIDAVDFSYQFFQENILMRELQRIE